MLYLHGQQLPVTTLFDTGANPTSFVNWQVAAWIESQQEQRLLGKNKHFVTPSASVSLAGSSLTCPIDGSVVFNLTFSNEVTRANETLYFLHAKVIDETTRCKPHLCQEQVASMHSPVPHAPYLWYKGMTILSVW